METTRKTKEKLCQEFFAEYNFSKYKNCESWGLKEWASALQMRWSVRYRWKSAFALGSEHASLGSGPLQKRWEDGAHSTAREKTDLNELATIQKIAMDHMLNPSVISLNAQYSTSSIRAIRDQSVADFFYGYYLSRDSRYSSWIEVLNHSVNYQFDVDDDGMKLISSDFDQLIASTTDILDFIPAWEMHQEIQSVAEPFFISVDLAQSDDILVDQFKAWLKKTRVDIGTSPKLRQFNEKDFSTWHEQRLLPYLDLSFLASTYSKKFPYENIAKIIYPDEYNKSLEELIRKTIKPNALELVSDVVISALMKQASQIKSLN